MTTVTFADLTHTGIAVDANNNPLAAAYIAAYARTQLGNAIKTRLFKYPVAFSEYLKTETPTIACFTHYMWNGRLGFAFARRIKSRAPQIATVMGGPNYPLDPNEQHAYLKSHPEIDFYVDGEGEQAFVGLFTALADVGFDASRLKASGRRVPSVHYISAGQFVRGDLLPRILDLDRVVPSPYTMGLLDEFFDERLTPMLQTSRGCPYSCTFCHDGISYTNKTRAFSLDRVREELAYVEARVKTPTLQLADLNWGMFPKDTQVAQAIAEIHGRSGWPRNVMTATAKNQKDRIIEMSRILGDLLQPGASIQSTDPVVLKHIKRTNLSLDAIVRMAKGATASHTGSFTEIILGLPGDTKEKHVKSVCDMLDAGIRDVRSFQFILLPGTEANDPVSRQQFGYDTGFRVLARCFGRYDMCGTDVEVAEIQEICLGNNTMARDDYFDCRAFDLTVAIFNNGGVLKEFFGLAETFGIPRSALINRIHALATATGSPLAGIYHEFRTAEGNNFFERREDLESFLARPGTMDAYLRGEYGINHIYKGRSEALLSFFKEMAHVANVAVQAELDAHGIADPILALYLRELLDVAVARRSDFTDIERSIELNLHFDFPAINAAEYFSDPRVYLIQDGLRFVIRHTEAQKKDLRKYFAQYGTNPEGIGQFLQRNDSHIHTVLYRTVEYGEPNLSRVHSAETCVPDIPGEERSTDVPTDPSNRFESPDDPIVTSAHPLFWIRS
jgi:radical SAM superfamily enzyme YgiQ (UPF0313 family)